MVIFTYKDYIKQKEYDKALFGLWNTIQKNKNQELCTKLLRSSNGISE